MTTQDRIEKLERHVRVLMKLQSRRLNPPAFNHLEPLKPDPELDRLLSEFEIIEKEINEETAHEVHCRF